MSYEYDFDNDSAQKFHSRSTMCTQSLKHDVVMCKNCVAYKQDSCFHKDYSEFDHCAMFKRED